MKTTPYPLATAGRQQGAALIITLVLLVILTLLGLASLRQTTLEERMSANLKDRAIGLQTAEVGLRAGEQSLTARQGPRDTDSSLNFGDTDYTKWSAADWNEKAEQAEVAGLPSSPRYFIEFWKRNEPCVECADKGMGTFYYRITANGQGGSGQAGVTLQEIKPVVFK
ncbi:pilus assembly PilX family protein [Methylibium rhizosphaerae]|uniref:pilus assembly PilX family protein n=1 Tax=Methylibium rhizosphaerae TaxID=2570323 RepID=UPI001126FAF7|nr:PilX N-terminal domain-containing pilus assembly protein [Methylibium rhizosphaerae]